MKDIKKDYYANPHGIQLKDFWKQTNKVILTFVS